MEEIKTLSFFAQEGEQGITSTSANHIANLAKEQVRDVHERLAAVRCYTEEVGLLTPGQRAIVKKGWTPNDLNALPELVEFIAKANSLIAWLREAIKEKERRTVEARNWQDEAAVKEWQDRFVEHQRVKPMKPNYPDVESVKKSWSVGQQEKYLSLEAKAAALGKFIHEDGHLSNARLDLMNKVQNPSKIDLNGSDTIVHEYVPTSSVKDVDFVFNILQKTYRETQAELNGMKKTIEDTIFAEKMRIDSEFAAAIREWNNKDQALRQEKTVLDEDIEMRRNELLKSVQALKIVIPNHLKALYETLNKQ